MKRRKREAAIHRVEEVVENGQRRSSQDSMEDDGLDAWKPSVYWVMFYLSIASIIVAFLGAIMYMEVRETEGEYFIASHNKGNIKKKR